MQAIQYENLQYKNKKVMVFRGKELIRTKIIIDDQVIEQMRYFNYLGNDIGYYKSYDIDVKIRKFQAIYGTINRILRNKTRYVEGQN